MGGGQETLGWDSGGPGFRMGIRGGFGNGGRGKTSKIVEGAGQVKSRVVSVWVVR